jgi:hypothetical protein
MCNRVVLAVLVLALSPAVAASQDWRNVTSLRQRSSETRLDVELRYGAGRLRLEPGPAGELYRVGIRYDADLFDPLTEYRAGRLKVGVEGGGRGIRVRGQQAGDMNLTLSPDVPLDLALAFGAVEADIELGGLRVDRMKIETGASDSRLRFSTPNPGECQGLELSMGAAAFRAEGLGNANCARIKTDGGVGDLHLDFSGHWRRDLAADVTMALGSVTLVIPEDVGVMVRRSTFLTSFDGRGFVQNGRDRVSENWDRATRKLTVELQGAFGTVNVRWTGPSTVANP